MIVLLIFAFDIKIERIFSFIKRFFISLSSDRKSKQSPAVTINKDETNIDKIKKLRPGKKTKKKEEDVVVTAEDLMREEEVQTNIRIIHKDERPQVQAENKLLEDEKKKVDLEKTGEIPEKDIELTEDEKLPDPWEENINYNMVGLDLLDKAVEEDFKVAEEELTKNAELLKEKLKLFDIDIKDISVNARSCCDFVRNSACPGS
jgi:S-DNA-T family DNA segregation ATPase FtsK/SpoIIIE